MVRGDNSAVSYGAIYEGRRPMIQVSFGGFKFALVEPNATVPATGLAGAETDTTLPKIEAAYTFKTDMFLARVMGGNYFSGYCNALAIVFICLIPTDFFCCINEHTN